MATSIREFHEALYAEHLEEGSFLYEQRLAYLHDRELAWTELEEFEERFDTHVDALVVGAQAALGVCRRQVAQGDFGELHVALRAFCRQQRRDLVYALLRDLDVADPEMNAAAADALKADCPAAWLEELASILSRHPQLAPVLAVVLGHRRAAAEPALLAALPEATEAGAAAILWALGRVRDRSSAAATTLARYTQSDTPRVAEAACRAAVRLGHDQSLRYAVLAAQTRPWLCLPLALGGGADAVSMLIDRARSERVTDESLLALGLLGDLGAVRAVFDCLVIPERAQAAALALQLITGAEFYEEVFVPDPVDPDELFDEEMQHYEQTGEGPKRADGQPFGAATVDVVSDPAVWKEWLTQHKSRFDPALRYRYGEPYSARALAGSLMAERVPNAIRSWIADELCVRYGLDFPLEIDMPVVEQKRLLERLEQWVQAHQAKFEPGKWYFHGRLAAG